MSGLVVTLAVATLAVIVGVIVVVVHTIRRDAEQNLIWARAHEERVARWAVAASAGRGDPTPRRALRAMPGGAESESVPYSARRR